MPVVYLLDSDEAPLPMVAAGLLDPNAAAPANPTVFEAFATAMTTGVSYLLNKNFRRTENIARYGGGAYAVTEGCDLTMPTGLTLVMSTGATMIDGPQVYSATKSLAIPNGLYDAGDLTVRAHIWLSKTGDLSYRTDLTQPATTSVYLGSVRTSGGAVHDIDYSGRTELRGIPYRRTADAGEPNADMPAKWRGLVRTAGALYWWDGTDYFSTLDACTVYADDTDTNPGNLFAKIDAGDGITVEVVVVEGERVLRITNTGISDDTDLLLLLPLDGSRAMAQPLDFGTQKGINLAAPTLGNDAVNKTYADGVGTAAVSTAAAATTGFLKTDGTRPLAGDQSAGGYKITNLGTPTAGGDVVNKTYADGLVVGLSTTDRAVRTDTGDTTPGSLADKITYSRGLLVTQTGPPTGDRKQNFALDTRAETLPAYSVTILPGESVILAIDFSTRGSFPSADLYTVSAYYDNITSGGLGHINDWATIRELPGHFGDALQGTAITPKTGTRCLLEITNHSPDLVAAFDESSHNFRIYTTLCGCGWEAGGSPSGTPTVTVYRYNSRKTLEFELDPVTIPKGATGTVEVDISGLGRFSGQYFVQAEPANTDAKVAALCSGRTHSTFQLEVTNAAAAASTDVTLTVTVQGERYLAASDSLNPDTPGDPTASVLSTTSTQQEIIIATFKEASPTGSDVLLRFPCHRDVTVGGTATLAISRAWCLFRPDSSGEILIYDYEHGVGATLIGLVTFTSASDAGTFDFASYFGEVTVPAGHLITFVCGAGSDAPLAQFCINLVGLVDVA